MHARQCAIVPVVTAGRIIGLPTFENISEMIMVNAALGNNSVAAVTGLKVETKV